MTPPPTDRIICCTADESCPCAVEEAARVEVALHTHDGQAVCLHHAQAPHDPSLVPFPCQRKAGEES